MKRRLLHLLRQNWTLKAFSLLVAFVLYLFVSVERSNVVEVEYPLVYDTADDIIITSDAPKKVVATLKGPWAGFRTGGFGDEPVVLHLEDAEPGTLRRRIETDLLAPPAGMAVLALHPAEVELTLDRLVAKQVMVEVDPLGRPAFGFEIAGLRADPDRVLVEGPMAKMRTLDFVHTKPVNLRDREEDVKEEVKLQPPVPPLRLVEETSVTVYVDISEEFTERTLDLAVRAQNAPPGTRLSPDEITVTLKGPRRFVDRLTKSDLTAVVNLLVESEGPDDRLTKAIAFSPPLPAHTELVGAVPTVNVTLPKRRRN